MDHDAMHMTVAVRLMLCIGALSAGMLTLQPVAAQPSAPLEMRRPDSNGAQKNSPDLPSTGEDLSHRLDRSQGVIKPPADVDPEMQMRHGDTHAPMPVIPPPGSPGGDQRVQPK